MATKKSESYDKRLFPFIIVYKRLPILKQLFFCYLAKAQNIIQTNKKKAFQNIIGKSIY
jgi:hypothetical protein